MTRQNFLDRIRALQLPDLVQVDSRAIKLLPPIAGEDMQCFPPFAEPAATEVSLDCELANLVRYVLTDTALQYRFWWQEAPNTPPKRYTNGDGQIGSAALSSLLAQNWSPSGEPGDSIFAAADDVEGVYALFGWNIPDAFSRHQRLSEVLRSSAGEQAIANLCSVLKSGRTLEVRDAETLAQMLPLSFGDVFLKKAMLALTLLANSWAGRRFGTKADLCVFADYQVPNVLRHYGVLSYSAEVARAVDSFAALPSAEAYEVAIRCATVLACEEIARHQQVSVAQVDWWCFQQRRLPKTPFHLCLTEAY